MKKLVLLATEARIKEVREGLRRTGVDFDEACEAGHARYSEARPLLDAILVDGAPDPALFSLRRFRLISTSEVPAGYEYSGS